MVFIARVGPAEPLAAELLRMLQSPEAKERSLARQWLPREEPDIVREILPLLGHNNQAVWRTAANVLADLANEVGAPGREADQRWVSNLMLDYLRTESDAVVAGRLLDLVHLVVPADGGVQPIARYLVHESLGMKARDALQLIGSTDAKRALREALTRADDDFELALIDSLDKLRDAKARDALLARFDDPDTRVRAAAARALAWTGDISLVPRYQELLRRATTETYADAGDAFLQLVDAIVSKGGRFERAMDLYAWASKNVKGASLQGAAIAALGRYGDERVVPIIIDAVENAEPGALDHAALEALAALQGYAGARAVLEHHDALLESLGPSLYSVYGRRGDKAFLPLLTEALASSDAYIRRVAMLALLDSDQVQGIQAVAEYGQTLEEEARTKLINNLELKAVAYRSKGATETAAAAYAGVYPLAMTDQSKRFALEGMMRYPSEAAYNVFANEIDEEELAQLPVTFAAGIARALRENNRPDEAAAVIDNVVARATSAADVRAILDAAAGADFDLARKLGFVTKWRVMGPFPWSPSEGFSKNPVGAPNIDLKAAYTTSNGEKTTWKPHQTGGANGIVNLVGVLGGHTQSSAYAYAEIAVPAEIPAVMRVGSDDGVKIWLNGEVVHENNVDRGLVVDQDQAEITLREGVNRILVHVTQGGGGWAMCLRFTHPDGTPLAFEE